MDESRHPIAADGPPERILVVDDNRMSRLMLVRAVEDLGYRATSVEGGEEAFTLLASEPFDAMLLDVMMPGMDGYEVLERLRRDPGLRDVPVIIVSAVEEAASVARGIELGALDHLPKPFELPILRARLRASLERKRLRALERAYVEQESALRESEKLAALGRLTAGLAHEINNPAAAARRGAAQIGDVAATIREVVTRFLELRHGDRVAAIVAALAETAPTPHVRDPIARVEAEEQVVRWLADQAVEEPWELAGLIVDGGLDAGDLDVLTNTVEPAALRPVVQLIAVLRLLSGLGEMIVDATSRISELVRSMKTYTRMDKAPLDDVDVHEGLDSTLVMLRHRLGDTAVERDYAPDLPHITAYGSELNQVWTNLLDNAADAVNGSGNITIRTRQDDAAIIIEVQDDGPGIPEEVAGRIFDPFVTSKPPGQGTGLGLSIAHRIITERHAGQIAVDSAPGRTALRVTLPIQH